MLRTSFRSVAAPIGLLMVTAPFVLALTATRLEAATPSGVCVSARIDAPFRLPDGSIHEAATLTLCELRAYSPVATLHRTYVNGRPTGMFVSHSRPSEAHRTTVPSVVFQGDAHGGLDLLGYVLPGEGHDVAYQLALPRPASTMASAAATAAASIAIVVAAK